MIRLAFNLLMFILLFLVVGTVILEEFPSVQPLFEEFKMHVVNIYNMSIIKYGAIPTILIIIAIFILVGGSKK